MEREFSSEFGKGVNGDVVRDVEGLLNISYHLKFFEELLCEQNCDIAYLDVKKGCVKGTGRADLRRGPAPDNPMLPSP